MKTSLSMKDGYQIETYEISNDLSVTLAYDTQTPFLPANGGLRLSQYNTRSLQEAEALTLAKCMTEKHKIYNTGFSGAKLVANGTLKKDSKLGLIESVGAILNKHQGKIYTGCDLNIYNEDMNQLFTLTPYVLNGIGSDVNTSTATAYGVFGSLMGVINFEKTEPDKVFLVHGCGKIGAVIVRKLLENGYRVLAYDMDPVRANIPGAENISTHPKWYETEHDYLVLCSQCGVVNEENAHVLKSRWIVSSANAPFANKQVNQILEAKGIRWIPDVISNAGAVICDSLEFYAPKKYQKMNPENLYRFVYQAKFKKTQKLLSEAERYSLKPHEALEVFFDVAENDNLFRKGGENDSL